jgi:hypothetical protein
MLIIEEWLDTRFRVPLVSRQQVQYLYRLTVDFGVKNENMGMASTKSDYQNT